MLVKAGVIDELQLRSALAQHDQWGGRLSKMITDMGLADEDTITETIAKQVGLPRVQLGHLTRDATVLAKVDLAVAEKEGVFPVQLRDNGKTLVLAMADPTDLTLLDQVQMRARTRIAPVVASETEIQHAILRYYRGQEPAARAQSRARTAVKQANDDADQDMEVEQGLSAGGGSSTVRGGRPPPPVLQDSGGSAGDLLDEILSAPISELTSEERTRLDSVRANQEKSGKILRVLIELLTEKGALTPREIQAKTKAQ